MHRSEADLFKVAYRPQRQLSSLHISHSIKYEKFYLWTRYPLQKESVLKLASFSFDVPSTVLFFFYLGASVGAMKIFTFLGTKLGVGTASEEPLLIPTR